MTTIETQAQSNGYCRQYDVRWADLDPNGHLRHTAYSDYGNEVCFRYMADRGFPAARFQALGLAPVRFAEETRFFKEVVMGETISVSVRLVALAPDGSQWKLVQEVKKADGRLAATVQVHGGWLDWKTRRLTAPPAELLQAFVDLRDSGEVAELPPISTQHAPPTAAPA